MIKKITLAVAMVALMALPAFAAVQNVKVGGDIVTTSVLRTNFDTGKAFSGTPAVAAVGKQNEILTQTRLNVDADLTDNVSSKVGLLNERFWGVTTGASADNQNITLETAYVTMKEFLYSPLSLTVGRQPLKYGNELIIGNSSAATAFDHKAGDLKYATNFDAIKAVLSYNPLTIDMFASRISNGTTVLDSENGTHDNINLFGINANYKLGDKMSTVVEGYMFAKTDDSTTVGTSNAKESTYVPGLRVSTNPIEGLNVQLEGAYELGKVAAAGSSRLDNRNAFALQGGMNYALPVLKDMKPVLSAQYTYLSGVADKAATGSSAKNWDSMFENQDNGRIFKAILPNSGIQKAVLGAEITPMKDLTSKASVTGIWNVTKNTVNSSKYDGAEADLDLTYAYTEDVKLGLSAGYFMTGKAYPTYTTAETQRDNASQLLSSVSVAF